MNRLALASCLMLLAGGATGGVAACSSSSSGTSPGDGGADGPAAGSFLPEIDCTDTLDSVYADPGDVTAWPKGAIIKCAKDQDLSIADMTAAVDVVDDAGDLSYTGKPFTSGAHVYRVLYRTERGDPASTPGYSSAIVFLPDTPRSGTTPLPIVVAAHGSFGQAGKCAPSKSDPASQYVREDFQHLVYPMVGLGYPVIAPDLAGYANYGGAGNPPSAYDDVADVGKSNLDGARALRKLIPGSVTQQIVLTGHSQGGYTALATLALSDSYGADGTIAAVAVYAPIWLSQRVWAAILLAPGSYSFAQSSVGKASVWYHYTHAELLDGPGHGVDLFQPSKQAAVKAFVDNDCWSATYPDLYAAGSSANDLFLDTYVKAIALPATPAGGGNCNGDATCQKWLDRMTADWPHLTGNAAKVPILVWYANNDTTVTPDAMQCVFNRLTSDGTSAQVCYDTDPVGHTGSIAENADYVADWVAQKTLGGPAPAAGHCTALAANDAGVPQIVDGTGKPVACNQLLSNQ
ncbi:MAG TPA: alpha/beta fold hydrolase [Polyangiaceae bacterium]